MLGWLTRTLRRFRSHSDPTGETLPPNATLLELHNRLRQRSRVALLQGDLVLGALAQSHALYMARQRALSHTEVDGSGRILTLADRLAALRVFCAAAGENVAAGQATAEQVVAAWSQSSSHRANMLRPSFRRAGFGAAAGSDGRRYWCAIYTSLPTRKGELGLVHLAGTDYSDGR